MKEEYSIYVCGGLFSMAIMCVGLLTELMLMYFAMVIVCGGIISRCLYCGG